MINEKHTDKRYEKKCAKCGSVFFRDKRCTWKHWSKAKFCTRLCALNVSHDMHVAARGSIKDALMSYVVISDESECWGWIGTVDAHGYAVFSYESKKRKAHRVSAQCHIGEIPKNRMVCHKCGNKKCSNPDHLYFGTSVDNGVDGVNLKENKSVKMTKDGVLWIRGNNKISAKEVSSKFGISISMVYRIRRKEKWAHI